MRDRVVRALRKSVRMDHKHTHVHTTPLAFALTVSCFLCIALPRSHSQPSPPLCDEQSYMCTIKVSGILDPVWKQIPPSQCIGADPSPQLSCSAPYESQNFTLKKVNHTTHTMTVVPTHTVNDVCSTDFVYIYDNLNNSLLQHYESVHNVIVFLDDCPFYISNFTLRQVNCRDAAFYFGEENEMLHKVLESLKDYCKRWLLVPIAAPLDDYDHKGDGAEVLKEVLELPNYCVTHV
ncbi:hypothetical protein VIGAN_11234600 [Vigna angularis var. angularis]|uniref:Wall-associated receptor kinase galacturonan-binding domain-containing protein n=1 Tax=Vigna angularis var. angularis TaxID=157739 RepID=A0A0S3TC75_PHAAN|nr:hypothetical protein VIGAN_11234600 [Vigna angularis var. angularis]